MGVTIYNQREALKKNWLPILVGCFAGALTAIVSILLMSRLFGLDEVMTLSLLPKSVTTPIAMDLSASIGGNVSLTAVSVVMCGFVGAIVGPLLIRILKIKSPVARGLSMGCASHGLGTARAIEMGAVEGAVSGLAIALMGVATALLLPLLNLLLQS
jgi:putative effector of murein hydrolase